MTQGRDYLHYSCSRTAHDAAEACTTMQPTENCFAGAAYVYTVTPEKNDYGRRSSIEIVQKHSHESNQEHAH
eukprot:1251577-Pleurochrysis_carterae.AAC.3